MAALFNVLSECVNGAFTADETPMSILRIERLEKSTDAFEVKIDSPRFTDKLWGVGVKWNREHQRLTLETCVHVEEFNPFDMSRVLAQLNQHNDKPDRMTAASLFSKNDATFLLVRVKFVLPAATFKGSAARAVILHNLATVMDEVFAISREVGECINSSPARLARAL